jgi:hypothetical protein
MVTLRRGVLNPISQVMNSMKWSTMSMLSLVSEKGLARILVPSFVGSSILLVLSHHAEKKFLFLFRFPIIPPPHKTLSFPLTHIMQKM